jgi:diketogulonate reductase-like aldo/keto reductase
MKLTGAKLAAMLREGFAAVDTAPTYENETGVGAGLRQGQYLICKVPRKATSAAAVRQALSESLRKLGAPRCHLLLLHWPDLAIEEGALAEVWGAMEAAREAGECGALGVCNFTVAALQTLLPFCHGAPPAVNQVERHPLCQQRALLAFCAAHRIVLQAHTPLGNGKPVLLQHETVVRVARATNLTPAGVLLRWNLAHGVAVAPKCSSKAHADDVLDAVRGTLAPEHMAALDALSTTHRFVNPKFMSRPGPMGARYGWQGS